MPGAYLCAYPDLLAYLLHACDCGSWQRLLEGLVSTHCGVYDVVAAVVSTPLPRPYLLPQTTLLQA